MNAAVAATYLGKARRVARSDRAFNLAMPPVHREALRLLAFSIEQKRLGPREVLFAMGDEADCAYVVVSGRIGLADSKGEVRMRTWERGAGLTMACGTGACAVCAAGALLGISDRDILAHLPGGDLRLRWDERSGHIFMTGPATEVFQGIWPAM